MNNLTLLAAAISSTGVALLDTSSTSARLVIPVMEQQQLVVNITDKTVVKGDLMPACIVVLENLDLSHESNQRFFALALAKIQTTKQTPFATPEEHQLFMSWRLKNITLPVLMGELTLTQAVTKATTAQDVFDFAAYGVDASLFEASFKGSSYLLAQDKQAAKGYKVYLRPEHKREFDDLVDEGKLCETYGRNLVKEGDFMGCFAVKLLLSAKISA